ncbi:penicillin acylase family protein [Spirosoma agri]|uniref:Penicillin acylase family protein n=1 Tax=Spirosoma agri TaxID=1987381 RepID=A0A6M0IKF4_9BACT|nr:penicillin acylase family protein [Spirosoma agri]NEU68644.1 penicillin acylase family protein [Spirosoma agri]
MRYAKAIVLSLITLVFIWALNRPWGSIPAFGPLLSPFVGFWQNAESVATSDEELTVEGAKAPVTVVFDDMAVPHVFAQNDYDVYFAQGYLTARDRLWQMEFQTHAASGRLAEIVGERALPLDRFNREIGMVYGAERALKAMMSDPTSKQIVEAYTAGVNAWINKLKPADYPIEYKLLGYAPEPWSPLKCALLLKAMTSTLASGADDLQMSNVRKKFGAAITNDLFPDYPDHEDPIIPTGTKWEFKPLPIPKSADSASTDNSLALNWPAHDPAIGSNNWAVGAQKSATGYPILANDPHLTLSLPSIWYQIQLVSPTMNACGVSLPGSPGVIIGFNKDIAWGVTNVGADVLDFYKIRFRDATKQEYFHGGVWKPVRRRLEVIKVKGQADMIDTVYYTHHGPIVNQSGQKGFRANIPSGYAARWIAHEPTDELRCYYLLNRAKNYDDYVQSLAYYGAPAQNFVFADVHKDIAISPNGKFPLKWKEQGKFLLDGTNPAHDWQGWIPPSQNPRVKNPPRGFVSSANQFSTDPSYPYYINWQFAPAERGMRINQRLTAMQRITTDSMRQLQNDLHNLRAAMALPKLLPAIKGSSLTGDQAKALAILKSWSYQNDTSAVGATIFTEWNRQLSDAIWKDEFDRGDSLLTRQPSFDRTLHLIEQEPKAHWFDNVNTPTPETMVDILTSSFQTTCDTLAKKHGPIGPTWAWGTHKATAIRHLVPGLDAFSVLNVQIGGGSGIVNATTERTGPSWRMVVELGPAPKAYGVYPGGQSGNPGSPHYQNMIEMWRTGQLTELVYLQSAQDKNPRIKRKMTLK